MSVDAPGSNLDVAVALDKAAKVFKENLSVWLVAGMIVFIVPMVCFGASAILTGIPIIGFLINMCLGLLVSAVVAVLMVGLLHMAVGALRGEKPAVDGLFYACGDALFPTVVAGVVIGVFGMIGSMLCLLPGLFVGVIYLHTYIFIERGQRDFWQAMESSRKMVMDNLGPWAIVFVVVVCLKLAGVVLCGIGLIPAIPFIALFLAAIYEAAGITNGDALAEAVDVTPSAE